LRGRRGKDTGTGKGKETANPVDEGSIDKGGDKKKEEAGTSGNGGRIKKDRTGRKKKAKTRTWSDVVKGLEPEDESEETDSEKS
jgi:hypothetical protein